MRKQECSSILHRLNNGNWKDEAESSEVNQEENEDDRIDKDGNIIPTPPPPKKKKKAGTKWIPMDVVAECAAVLISNFPHDVKEDDHSEFGWS